MRNRGKKALRATGVLVFASIVAAVAFAQWTDTGKPGHSTNDIAQTENARPQPSGISQGDKAGHDTVDRLPKAERDKDSLSPPPLNKNLKRPLAFLVVGIDERRHDSGRTDTIIVFTANPDNRTIKMMSIPRDTKTALADVSHHVYDKINHAYSRGKGLESTKKTVEQFLGIPIDYTVSINMRGFEQLVDTFGGVDVNVPRDFTVEGHHYTKGPMTLDGRAALYYVRERKNSNDFDRNLRQQQVLRSLIDKSSRFSTVTKIDDILKIVGRNVKTNLTPWQLYQLQRLYGNVTDDDIERLELTGTDEWSDAYYFIVNESSKNRAVETLRAHLELDRTQATFH